MNRNSFDPRQGQTATRALKAFIVGGGSTEAARGYAAGQNWKDAHDIDLCLKGAVGASTLANGDSLVGINGADLLPLVRQREIISRLVGIRRIPFNCHLTAQSARVSASWVAQGAAAPLSKNGYAASVTLPRLKIVSLAAIDVELARSSDPVAEQELSRDFSVAVATASDIAFIDPSNAGTAGETPASVCYGAPSFICSGGSVGAVDSDLTLLQQSLIASGSTLEYAAWIMHPNTVCTLSLLRVGSGDLAYPQLNVRTGGFIAGIPVIVSASVPYDYSPLITSIVLLDASRVWIADDGDLRFDTAKYTSLQMSNAPTADSVTGTGTTGVSMMQTSSLALRGTRTLNFKIADAAAAAVLSGVHY
jgi:HK97 family phage major capsid protein